MDSKTELLINPEPCVVVCLNNLKTDEDAMRAQADEVSNKIDAAEISDSSVGKLAKMPAKDAKLSMKRKQAGLVSNKIKASRGLASSSGKNKKEAPRGGKLPPKRTKHDRLPIPQMVMDAIKALKKRNGASVETILEYMEGQHRMDAKLVKRYVSRYVKSAVQKGILDQLNGEGEDGRFKIKKAEKIAKGGQKLNAGQKKIKAARK